MSRWAIPVLVAVVVAAAACMSSSPSTATRRSSASRLVIDTGERTVRVDVEVADEDAERRIGLMGRETLGANAGMVFLFPEPLRTAFWMKDTLIPLSIAFWDDRGRIVSILDMHPCEADPCPTYDPGVEFAGALEVNQGFFREHGVSVGDRVELSTPDG